MARNHHGVIWTRISGRPEKMGDLVLTDRQIAFTYTRDYLDSGQPGFCLLGDGSIWGDETVSYPISERVPVFPRLLSLIPGNNPRNLQRRHYLNQLRARLGHEPSPGMETEWRLLMMGGHGGIGHIDLFSDDRSAEAWFEPAVDNDDSGAGLVPGSRGSRSELWRMLKREVMDDSVDFDPRLIEQMLGPTPSVGGMIPKLLVSITAGESTPIFYPPGTTGKQEVVLKVEPPEYAGLLDLEALCLQVHREAGFDVPFFIRYDVDDLRLLAIERFDRRDGLPLPMESLFSVIATGDHHFRETGDRLLEELGDILARLGQVAGLAEDSGELLYRRLLMALLTGNGDLHLDNLALLGGLSDCRLAPVYDPAPMRAWPRHDLVSAIPFDASSHTDRGTFFLALGQTFGLSAPHSRQCVEDALTATTSYGDRVMALKRVPGKQRERLRDIAGHERALLAGSCI